MCVFPRVKFSNHFVRGAPAGSNGTAHRSGWMTDENCPKFLEHFKLHVKPSKGVIVLILLENHNSHLATEVLEFAEQNGIILLSFPPHCSHKVQPLDISFFGPLKKRISQAQQNWLCCHPGQCMTIYDAPGTTGEAWKDTLTVGNITAGFGKAGIFPFNRDVFTYVVFASSSATDCLTPLPRSDRPDVSAAVENLHMPDQNGVPCAADMPDHHDVATDDPTHSSKPATSRHCPESSDQRPQENI